MSRTEVKISPTISVNESSSIVSLGSCFAENVGGLLTADGHQVLVNPHGILFSPTALVNSVYFSVEQDLDEKHLGEYQGEYFHFDYHSRLNGKSREEVINNVRSANTELSEALKSADFLILTFGTAWVWRYLETQSIIANCHKVPGDRFEKGMLDLKDMADDFEWLLEILDRFNPNIQIIISVSPVRHTRNGLPEDKYSKAALLYLAHFMAEQYDGVHYFPAYEIVIDELRDYHHYKDDLIHPNDEAIQYVYKKFKLFAGILNKNKNLDFQ